VADPVLDLLAAQELTQEVRHGPYRIRIGEVYGDEGRAVLVHVKPRLRSKTRDRAVMSIEAVVPPAPDGPAQPIAIKPGAIATGSLQDMRLPQGILCDHSRAAVNAVVEMKREPGSGIARAHRLAERPHAVVGPVRPNDRGLAVADGVRCRGVLMRVPDGSPDGAVAHAERLQYLLLHQVLEGAAAGCRDRLGRSHEAEVAVAESVAKTANGLDVPRPAEHGRAAEIRSVLAEAGARETRAIGKDIADRDVVADP
jgi:hypothetical protein